MGAGHLLDQRITFLVVAMGVVDQQEFDSENLKPEIRDGRRDRRPPHALIKCCR